MSTDRFEAMHVFCKVIELGSFAGAADRLEMSTSAVSRQVAQLERLLGARLLNRTTRRLSLTEDGRSYYERCLQLLADLEEMEEMVGNATAHPRGLLRLTAPVAFGATHLADALADFARQYPQMKFDIQLSDKMVDLVEDGLDLAIRVGRLGNQNLVARRIGTTHMQICASPAYLARCGTPTEPAELARHECLIYSQSADHAAWLLHDAQGTQHRFAVNGAISASDGNALAALAAKGVGITLAPDYLLAPWVNSGELIPILAQWNQKLPISAVYPSRRHLSAKVRSFVSHLEQWLARDHRTSPGEKAVPQG